MKRDDMIHPLIQGNKWRKLKYNLEAARAAGYRRLLTFGGYYSNHLYATAAAASLYGFEAVGVVRGEEPAALSHTLQFARSRGMRLKFVSRAAYEQRYDVSFLEMLRDTYGDFYLLPDGGSNALALRGAGEIISETGSGFDVVCVPCGTGGTLAGIACALNGSSRIIGFSPLRGNPALVEEINRLTREYSGCTYSNFTICNDFTFGGYARWTDALIDFVVSFEAKHGILLDPIYTSKMMYGINTMIREGKFARGTRLLCIHTGGLQGWGGVKQEKVKWSG